MTGRPINQDRLTAIELGFTTYKGMTHKRCGTNVRYLHGGNCVHCARTIAREQREARIYLKKMREQGELDTAPEPEVETEEQAEQRRQEAIDAMM